MRVRVASMIVLFGFVSAGCGTNSGTGHTSPGSPTADADPPIPVAPAIVEEPDEKAVSELQAKLKEKNPNYQDNAQIRAENGQVTAVSLEQCAVTDISPLAGLPLQYLDLFQLPVTEVRALKGMPLKQLFLEATKVADIDVLSGMPLQTLWLNKTDVTDFAPLDGMKLEFLNLNSTKVKTIGFVKGMPLNTLWLPSTNVNDLSPLAGMRLVSLDIENTPVTDLSVVGQMPTLQRLNIAGSQVKDLTPLKELRLNRLVFSPERIETGLDIVRNMPSIQTIGETLQEAQPPAQFWQAYDARSR